MSEKTQYAHGFGGMNADTEIHPNCQVPSSLSPARGYAASHAKLYESLCRLRLLIITSAPQLIARSEYQNSHTALKEAEDLMRHNEKLTQDARP